jgi:hypothetical protein
VCDASFVSLIEMLVPSYKQLIRSSSSSVFTAHSRFFAPAARRDSKKIQPKGPRRGQKGMRKSAAKLIFFLGPVRASRNPLAAAKKVRAIGIEIAIAILNQFCLTNHKMCSPSRSCFVQSSPQRFIKAAHLPRPHPPGHEGARKGERGGAGMCCCIHFLLRSVLVLGSSCD